MPPIFTTVASGRMNPERYSRADLAGGTLDIWPLYLNHPGAVTVNFAVNRYTTCVLETRETEGIHLCSEDLKICEEFQSLAHLRKASKPKLPLLAYVLRFFGAPSGLSMRTGVFRLDRRHLQCP